MKECAHFLNVRLTSTNKQEPPVQQCVLFHDVWEATWALLLVALVALLVVLAMRFKRNTRAHEPRGEAFSNSGQDGAQVGSQQHFYRRLKASGKIPLTASYPNVLQPMKCQTDGEKDEDFGAQLLAIQIEIQRLDQLVTKLEDKKKSCERLAARVTELTAENEELKRRLAEASGINESLNIRLDGFEKCRDELKDVEEDIQSILGEMCPKSSSSQKRIEKYNEKKSRQTVKDVLCEAEVKYRYLKEHYEFIMNEYDAVKQYTKTLEKDKHDIILENKSMVKLLDEANDAKLRLREELSAMKKQKAAADLRNEQLERELRNMREAKVAKRLISKHEDLDLFAGISNTVAVMDQKLKTMKQEDLGELSFKDVG
ncbi:puff II/9-1 protein-like [Erpetoichthys calabaricus]|uniref:puff II/9-1 protein-like n=1 Tax=Erpetoichthys calabaricus TaxID=27687 RepID=UPI002234B6F4|nr:puff II/9-1 protein-like [Erpetoichthys calabaricus]